MPDDPTDVRTVQAAESQDDASTLAAVEAKMAAIQDVPVVDDDVSVDDNTSVDTTNDDVTPDPTDSGDDSPTPVDENTTMLPSGHRRAALARGYTNEEIDHHLETKPGDALVRFGELYTEWQDQNSQWSERGRQLRQVGQEAPKPETPNATPEVLKHYDTEAMIAEHGGNEDLITALVAPLNAMVDRVNSVTEKLEKSEQFLRNTEQDALTAATQEFFKGTDMTPFNKVYGTDRTSLTDEQVKSRMELLQEADTIIAGAADHGRGLSVRDALERAHVIVSQGTRDEAIRQSIRDSMKKQTRTTQSSHRASTSDEPDRELSDDEIVTRTEARLQAMRNK